MTPSTTHPAYASERGPLDDRAPLVAEIAERLIELSEAVDRNRVSAWLVTLANLHRQHHAALWMYLAWQTGDASRIGRSYEEAGDNTSRSRQAGQQERERAFAAIEMVEPRLAVAMRELYESYSPEAHAERYRQKTCDPKAGPQLASRRAGPSGDPRHR